MWSSYIELCWFVLWLRILISKVEYLCTLLTQNRYCNGHSRNKERWHDKSKVQVFWGLQQLKPVYCNYNMSCFQRFEFREWLHVKTWKLLGIGAPENQQKIQVWSLIDIYSYLIGTGIICIHLPTAPSIFSNFPVFQNKHVCLACYLQHPVRPHLTPSSPQRPALGGPWPNVQSVGGSAMRAADAERWANVPWQLFNGKGKVEKPFFE